MLFDDTYKTIAAPAEGIFRDRGSRFIAYLFPLKSEEEAKEIISRIKSEHPKARHHCWALRLSPDRSVFRLNDDGEPAGSAGRPILNTLLSADVTNILAVVVRYFGGTLLGIPGLINAYKTAVQEALQTAQLIEKTINDVYRVSFDYPAMNEVMKISKDEQLEILTQKFDNRCLVEISIPKSAVNRVVDRIKNIENAALNYIRTE